MTEPTRANKAVLDSCGGYHYESVAAANAVRVQVPIYSRRSVQ